MKGLFVWSLIKIDLVNNKIFCFIFSVFFISCSKPQVQKNIPMDGEYYTIDLDGKKETSIPLSSHFKGVRTIILESNKDCLIGFIDKIQVFDEYIYIFDSNKTRSLFVFDMKGKFIRKIGGIGNAPGEYLEPNDFTLDTENRAIYLCDLNNRVHKYQLDGTYLNTITIDAPDSKAIFIQFHNGRLYSSPLWWKKFDDNYMLLEINPSNGKIISRSLPIKYNKGWNEAFFSGHSRFFMSYGNNPPRYNQMFMDYIVSIGKEITPYIKLKSKYLTTEKDIENFRGKDYMATNSTNIYKSSKKFNVHCFVENEAYILFRYGGMASSYIVTFNKKTKEVKLADHFINDLIYNHDQQSWLGLFEFSDSKGVYEILNTQSDFFNDFKNSIKNNEIAPDLDKIDQLMKLDSESNPVIFFYEFK